MAERTCYEYPLNTGIVGSAVAPERIHKAVVALHERLTDKAVISECALPVLSRLGAVIELDREFFTVNREKDIIRILIVSRGARCLHPEQDPLVTVIKSRPIALPYHGYPSGTLKGVKHHVVDNGDAGVCLENNQRRGFIHCRKTRAVLFFQGIHEFCGLHLRLIYPVVISRERPYC